MDGKTVEHTLGVIASRYMKANVEACYTYRPFFCGGIRRLEDYRYHADLKELLPEAALGTFSYAWAQYESKSTTTLRFALIPYGPSRIYVNGELLACSDIFSERFRSKQIFDLPVKKGMNQLVICFENTTGGFGGEFGTWVGKLDYYLLMPQIREAQEGVCFSLPVETCLQEVSGKTLQTLSWLPEPPAFAADLIDIPRVYPNAQKGEYVLCLSHLQLECSGWYTFDSQAELFVDGVLRQGSFELEKGRHSLSLLCKADETAMLTVFSAKNGKKLSVYNHLLAETSSYRWLLAGPFSDRVDPLSMMQFDTPFETTDGTSFFRLEGENQFLRLYNDNALFGHWNYPLGVTLYGLVETERLLRASHAELADTIALYLVAHLRKSLQTYDYAKWDASNLGGATAVHHLMTSLDSLDDCGSFASTILEIAKDHAIVGYEKVIEVVGDYISKKQPRLSDGTFFRTGLMHAFHENTLWVDDLYMSVPFLCRYADFTKEFRYLDDAAHQFLGFAHYLYRSDIQMMSHVYDFDRNIATGIPWGRGNGWALFSLSELLSRLSQEHPLYGQLFTLFRNLSEGYLKVQGENGMFHQVLTMSSSYEETSCTAMFACSFSRGVRNGWYEDPLPFSTGAKRAWKALQSQAIDQDGHVWGVCRGSEFSCSPLYYANELLPRLDDTHGIGIVLLAGCEYEKLLAFENKEE